ncbi:DNA-binding transcription factor [Friedmanniomyces endolithicus]|nr:DNA-binding transcription factor [Friedmanniomyces endolithicus]KAK0805820.1 DNA-binding transcription factor [Friedmanniomyces endolithicus]
MASFPRGGSRSSSASRHQPPTSSYASTSAENDLVGNHFDTMDAQAATAASASASGAYGAPSFSQDYTHPKWALDPTYSHLAQQEHQHLPQPPVVPSQTGNFTNDTYLQSYGRTSQDFGRIGPGSNHISADELIQNTSPPNIESSTAFPSFQFNPDSFDLPESDFDSSASLDPSLLSGLDPTSDDLLAAHQSLNNHASSQDQMAATMQSQAPTPPHLMPEMARRQSNSPSPHATPGFPQTGFNGMNRPRNLSESLDPASAMFPPGQGEWSHMGAYRTHRRTPSDNISDISSHSNQASPYLGTLDSFDTLPHSSPMLDPTQDPAFNGDLLQGFSLSENRTAQQSYMGPGHSPNHSPRLIPQHQQALPPFTADNNYGLLSNTNGGYLHQPQNDLDMFSGQGHEAFPSLNHTSPGDIGAADQMSPPEFKIDYAPPSRPEEDAKPTNVEATLSPPLRTQSRNRMRAKSDPYAVSRPSTPGLPGRGRSPSLQPQQSDPSDLLAPTDNQPLSRSPSPVRGRNGSLGAQRARSSSNASDHRDYLIELATERTPSASGGGGGADKTRLQKHPANFQCTLCPKRFTRAYNLRSHLRTHTDERPFVCTVCGKAFARQHDRKRHEGLHSGEKKFVCRGNLQSGAHWGCGRRFARADALGRHFRSEAGRVCIKPLLDEEAAERQRAWMEEQQQAQVAAGLVAPPPLLLQQQQPQMDLLGNFLPAALLQQYPALAGIDWNAMPQGPPPDEEVYSGRSSFDASSGGEYGDEMSGDEVGFYPDPTEMGVDGGGGGGGMNNAMGAMNGMGGLGMGGQHVRAGAQGYSGVYGNQAGDYLGDFEGR